MTNLADLNPQVMRTPTWNAGKPGDCISGAIVSIEHDENIDRYQKSKMIFTIRTMPANADGSAGLTHLPPRDAEGKVVKGYEASELVETSIGAEEDWRVYANIAHNADGTTKDSILLQQLKKVPLYGVCKVNFKETKPSDYGSDAKIVEALAYPSADGKGVMINEEVKAAAVEALTAIQSTDTTPADAAAAEENRNKPF